MICSQTATHVQTHTDPINASDTLYWALSKGKKDWKINSGHPAKAAAVWSHVTTTVSERPRRRVSPEGGTFQVHSQFDDTELLRFHMPPMEIMSF